MGSGASKTKSTESLKKDVNGSIAEALAGNQKVQNEIQDDVKIAEVKFFNSVQHAHSSPVAGDATIDMSENTVRDMPNGRESTNEITKGNLKVALNNGKTAVLMNETTDGDEAATGNRSDTFENANQLSLEGAELDMDAIACEKGEKLPMDAETEMLSSAGNKIKDFLTNCNLEMDHKEWANESVSKEAKALIALPIRYKKKTLRKESRSKVTEKFIELNCINIFNDFFVFSLKRCSIIYEKDEKYFTGEIKTLKEQNTDNSLDEEISNYRVLLYTQRILSSMMAVAINCTNVNFTFCKLCVDGGFISAVFRLLEIFLPLNEDEEMKDLPYSKVKNNSRLRIFNHGLGTLLNLSKFMVFHQKFEELSAVQKVLPYLKCQQRLFAMKALLVLSHLIEESNNHLIMSDEEPIKLLLHYIRSALKDPNHRYIGFQLSELIEGLQLIALNDTNKATIGQNDGIKILSLVLSFSNSLADEVENTLEKVLSCKALWILSFRKENRDAIRNDGFILDFLEKLCKESPDKDIKNFSGGVRWEVLGKEMRKSKKEEEEEAKKEEPHIMISYQWDHQDILIDVRDALLEAGYKIWMDIDQMGGSTLEAMANAVEGAKIVLMSVSKKYKDSANCRSEAEYAYQLKRTIIPLMMEKDYQPDGWLGFIVGAKYWISFTERKEFTNSVEKLLKEINVKGESSKKVDPLDEKMVLPADPVNEDTGGDYTAMMPNSKICNASSKPRGEDIQFWTVAQVSEWLHSINVESISTAYKEKLDGKALLSLQQLRKEAPETFYQICRQDLDLSDFLEMMHFVDELKKLLKPS